MKHRGGRTPDRGPDPVVVFIVIVVILIILSG